MKNIISGAICAIGILGAGCDMDVPTEQVGSFTLAEFCGLTGGVYNQETKHCICDRECGDNVTCVVDSTSNKYVCMGAENLDYPEYTCTMKDMTLCFERVINNDRTSINNGKTSGYIIKCDGTNWSSPLPCDEGYSCKAYSQHNLFYSTECGECQNDGKNCIGGTRKNN